MEPSADSPPPSGIPFRRQAVWAAGIGALIVLAAGAFALWKHGAFGLGGGERADEGFASPSGWESPVVGPGTTLSIRKKLDLPLDLNVEDGNLAPVMAWIEEQLGLSFLYQADVATLERVTIHKEKTPLREILGDVFSRRNLAFILQYDAIVVIPCKQSVKTTVQNGVRIEAFEAETEILGRTNEPVEMYCGDRGQFRIWLLTRMAPEASRGTPKARVRYQLYKEGQLQTTNVVETGNDQWVEAPIDKPANLTLSLRPAVEDGIDVALGVRFHYRVETSATPAAPGAAEVKAN